MQFSTPPSFRRTILLLCITLFFILTTRITTEATIPVFDDTILRFGMQVSSMGTLDPHFAAGSQDRAFADMVFNGLLRYQPGNAPQLEPDLAANIPEFKMVNGQQIWTVQLRRGVMFHPGPSTPPYELTADDVVFSLQKSADKKYSAYAGEYSGMDFKKRSTYSLEIILDKPASPTLFLPKLANYAGGFIISKKAVETVGYEAFKKHPVGTGPYMFSAYEPGNKISLTSNKKYFRGKPHLSTVEMHLMPNIADREQALLTGKLDFIIGSANSAWIKAMQQHKNVKIDTFGVGEIATIFLNPTIKPFDDIRVRKAIAYALSRTSFIKTVDNPFAGLVCSPVPVNFLPGGLTCDQTRTLGLTYDYDTKKARTLLKEAGYPNGFSLELISSKKKIYRTYYDTLSTQLADVGITCSIKTVPHAEMHKIIRSENHPLVIYPAWRPNADAYLTRFFHSDSIIVTGNSPDTNFSSYKDIDTLIESARAAISPEKQIQLWQHAQIRILSDMVAFPVMYTTQLFVRNLSVDYGHSLVSSMALYPQITEKTRKHFQGN